MCFVAKLLCLDALLRLYIVYDLLYTSLGLQVSSYIYKSVDELG